MSEPTYPEVPSDLLSRWWYWCSLLDLTYYQLAMKISQQDRNNINDGRLSNSDLDELMVKRIDLTKPETMAKLLGSKEMNK